MNYNVLSYCIYLLITIYVIVVVGNVLYENGKPFLLNVFHGNYSIAHSANNILLAGYYLVNIGYCIMTLKIWQEINSINKLIEILSMKVGMIIFLLGIMHLFNITILLITEKKYQNKLNNNI